MKALTIILMAFNFTAMGQRLTTNDLHSVYKRGQPKELQNLVRRLDSCFDESWKLDSVVKREISHFKNGFLFFFHKDQDSFVIRRWYSIDDHVQTSAGEYVMRDGLKSSERKLYFDSSGLWMIVEANLLTNNSKNIDDKWEMIYSVYRQCKIHATHRIVGDNMIRLRQFSNKKEFEQWLEFQNVAPK